MFKPKTMDTSKYTSKKNYKNQKKVFTKINTLLLRAIDFEKKNSLKSSLSTNRQALHLISICILHDKLHNDTRVFLTGYAVKLKNKIIALEKQEFTTKQTYDSNENSSSLAESECTSVLEISDLEKMAKCLDQYVLHYFLLSECENIFHRNMRQQYPDFENQKEALFTFFENQFNETTRDKYVTVVSLPIKLKDYFEKKIANNISDLEEDDARMGDLQLLSQLQRTWNRAIPCNKIETEADFVSYESGPEQAPRQTRKEFQLNHLKKMNATAQVNIF